MYELNRTEEKALRLLLKSYDGTSNRVGANRGSEEFDFLHDNIKALKDLEMMGYLKLVAPSIGFVSAELTDDGIYYFEDMANLIEEQKRNQSNNALGSTFNVSNGNVVIGNVYNSDLSISTTISNIEIEIENKAETEDEKEELKKLLEEAKEIAENIKESGYVQKRSGFFNKISNHLEKHGWFYGAVIQLLGQAALMKMGGQA